MFRATIKTSGEEIVSLDNKWDSQLEFLRSLAKRNEIVCPGCWQPVRLRAGRRRRRHFAHKHLQNCPYGYESPTLLNARAILYQWLISKFGSGVQIEKKFDIDGIPRHVDCWVETAKGDFAYWIIESGMKPKKRDGLKYGAEKIDAQFHWIFVSEMLREDQTRTDCIYLTTTEREFMKQTPFDEVKIWRSFLTGKSLHYIDPGNDLLMTYRKLRLDHAPQLYQGAKVSTEISSVLVSPKTGEMVHPGEPDELEELKKEKIVLERELKEREEILAEVRQNAFDFPRISKPSMGSQEVYESSILNRQEAACLLCGQITTDYWYLNRKDNTCKCRECYQEGRE